VAVSIYAANNHTDVVSTNMMRMYGKGYPHFVDVATNIANNHTCIHMYTHISIQMSKHSTEVCLLRNYFKSLVVLNWSLFLRLNAFQVSVFYAKIK
jgi:hypothetical protein